MVDKKPRLRRNLSKRKQLEQDLAHVNQEMYKRNAELAETNRTLSLLRTIDTLVLQSHDSLAALCDQITKAMVDNSEYSWAAIFGKIPHHDRLDLFGWRGTGSLLLKRTDDQTALAYINGNDDWLSKPARTHIIHLEHSSPATVTDYLHCSAAFLADLRDEQHVNIICLTKLMARENLVGVMAVGFSGQHSALTEHETALLDRLSEAVGVAVDNKQLYEENQHVLKQLQTTNAKLRALDEAKDEFISMASHQLRTPLTSIKGYVSMVLEGDGGKINHSQKDLLDQAFASSQRMVYLIADLLNVSRLRTGKFVIENKPTNLANLIEGEISQLTQTAKAKNLTLTYTKPKTFPELMLDETKIRQVIMNFADNAIYYTPAGGHIMVNLIQTPDSVEFTVVDDGIGVPKAAQHHMFSKFYRADNAKKARPDGTGLGLFMAQKVVVAQGGAIVFTSEEGKGSTFGFSFPKAKLKVPAHLKPAPSAASTGTPKPVNMPSLV